MDIRRRAQFRDTGPFIGTEELRQSHVFRLLSGQEKFDDERDAGDGDPVVPEAAQANPIYDAEIAALCQQWELSQAERQQKQKHIQDLTEKVVNGMARKQWVAICKAPRKLPRFSAWTKQQQRFVVDMMARYWATGVPTNPPLADRRDVTRFMKLLSEMRAEQQEFLNFAKEVNLTQVQRYNYINEFIDKYIHLRMTNKIRHTLRTYPTAYEPVTMLPLAPPVGAPPVFAAVSAPLELGRVPICVMPHLKTYTDVKRQTSFLELMFPTGDVCPKAPNDSHFTPRDGTYLYKMPVSSDPNVSLLSAQQEFDVVTSPSALKTLLDNSAPAWDRQWELPVTVRIVPGTQPGTHRKVVFVDKPLPPRSMNCLERNTRGHKHTVRILVCKRVFGDEPADYSIWEEQYMKRKKAYEARLLRKAENRQKEMERQQRKKKKKNKKRKVKPAQCGEADASDPPEKRRRLESGEQPDPEIRVDADRDGGDSSGKDSSDDEGLQIDCAGQEDKEGGQTEEEEEGGQMEEGEGGLMVVEEGGPKKEEGQKNEDLPREDAKECAQEENSSAATGGVDSTLNSSTAPAKADADDTARPSASGGGEVASGCDPTTPKDTAPPPASPPEPGEVREGAGAAAAGSAAGGKDGDPYLHPPPGLNVHYRVWQLGKLRLLLRATTHAMRETKNAGLVRYSVHAKVAYQPAYGIEVMTRPEVISQWLDCLLRPNSRVVRVHLDPISQMVLAAEERSFSQLTEEFAKYDTGFKPPYGLQVLESVLVELTQQPPGQYLLSHDSRSGAFVRLSRASAPDGGSLKLQFPVSPVRTLLDSPRCLGLDPSILTPYNTRYGRVPATFHYRDTVELGEGGWKEHWAKQKEQGITRKKKKKNKSGKQPTDAPPAEAD
ncbi:Little elongation complex subunit 2 [Amphibalanus amphitrite]|uniref:Little elongation complex subunit 2 n=1 Tax=Amphibalanus amphitrite TaxID=1232801 RepID=A0A6A4WED8_AMPAM|nr:Little elongation complex subunit 2 [Amphibalanus amphitrite]